MTSVPQADTDYSHSALKEEADNAAEFNDDAAALMDAWPEYQGWTPMENKFEQALATAIDLQNMGVRHASVTLSEFQFPGGGYTPTGPSRRKLAVSGLEWVALVEKLCVELREDMLATIDGFDKNGATEGPIAFPANVEEFKAKAARLVAICEESAK